ncbi:MAG: hypothetical protein ACOX6D_02545 [Thermoguttaceae bacterium]|jgi:hypothetical protein
MAILNGNLRVTGSITADNYPPAPAHEVTTITGDGERVLFPLTHTLGVLEVQVSVYALADNSLCLVRTVLQSIGNFVICFADPPQVGESFRVVATK